MFLPAAGTPTANRATAPARAHVPAGVGVAIVVSLVGIVAVGIWADPLIEWSMDAAQALPATGP